MSVPIQPKGLAWTALECEFGPLRDGDAVLRAIRSEMTKPTGDFRPSVVRELWQALDNLMTAGELTPADWRRDDD